jgi:GxxExxY protein
LNQLLAAKFDSGLTENLDLIKSFAAKSDGKFNFTAGAISCKFGKSCPEAFLFLTEDAMKDDDLTHKIIGCAYKVHNTLGPGFLEKVYENALRIELEKLGLNIKQQEPINVTYDGQVVGEYYADLWVEGRVVVELKATRALIKQHEVQLVNYLTATSIEVGLLLNFGTSVEVKRKFRQYTPGV